MRADTTDIAACTNIHAGLVRLALFFSFEHEAGVAVTRVSVNHPESNES